MPISNAVFIITDFVQTWTSVILNQCLEWDKRVLNELTHSRQWFNTLIPRSRTTVSVRCTIVRLVTLECTLEVIETTDAMLETGVRVRPWNKRRRIIGLVRADVSYKLTSQL